jgi:hypothetical protein
MILTKREKNILRDRLIAGLTLKAIGNRQGVSSGRVSQIIRRAWHKIEMEWQPKEDITTYELALCMPYLVRHNAIMPYEVDTNDKHLRHFKITDHN